MNENRNSLTIVPFYYDPKDGSQKNSNIFDTGNHRSSQKLSNPIFNSDVNVTEQEKNYFYELSNNTESTFHFKNQLKNNKSSSLANQSTMVKSPYLEINENNTEVIT